MGHSLPPNENLGQTEKAVRYLTSKTPSVPERALPAGMIIRPRCWTDDAALYYEFENSRASTTSYERVLLDFIKLSKGSEGDIREFAEKYGPLMLCKTHRLPAFSPSRLHSLSESEYCAPVSRKRLADSREFRHADVQTQYVLEGCEPLTAWRAWSRRAEIALLLADTLHSNKESSEALWHALGVEKPKDREGMRLALAWQANAWIEYSLPVPAVTLAPSGSLELRFVPYDHLRPSSDGSRENWWNLLCGFPQSSSIVLWQALGLQLAAAISGAGMVGVAICNGCGRIYTPDRTPAAGRLRFCKLCGPTASWRLSKRRKRHPERR
jgi:hypothetical protein